MKKVWFSSLVLCCIPLVSLGQVVEQGNTNSSLSGQAQIFMQLQQMQSQITQLQGQLEQQQLLINQLQKESLDRYQELDKRLSSSAKTASTANSSNNVGAIDANVALSPPIQQSTEPVDPAKEKTYYEAAFGLIKKKDYANAAKAFTAFLDKFPKSQYAGNAQYWLAEVYLAQGNTQVASDNFNKVLQQYPKHPKVPDAMYKLADIQLKLGNKDRAKELFKQLVTQYPYSSATALAKRSLQTLN